MEARAVSAARLWSARQRSRAAVREALGRAEGNRALTRRPAEAVKASGMRLTHEERQVFSDARQRATAERPPGRNGAASPERPRPKARVPTRGYRRRWEWAAQLTRKGPERPDAQGMRRWALAIGVARRASLVQEVEFRGPGGQVCDSRPNGQASYGGSHSDDVSLQSAAGAGGSNDQYDGDVSGQRTQKVELHYRAAGFRRHEARQ
jgi:hypothetical protein